MFTVSESGVYAIGIQTLTNTESVFITSGLTTKTKNSMKNKFVSNVCLNVKYTYLVTSTLQHDSRSLEGGAVDLLSLLVGDGLQKIFKQNEVDNKLRNEISDFSEFADCKHDDLPASFPPSEIGYDRSFTLLTQSKAADFIEIVVEHESIMRV